MNDFTEDQKVIAYRNGELAYEGLWGNRPDWLNDNRMYSWYLLDRKVEDADILIVVSD